MVASPAYLIFYPLFVFTLLTLFYWLYLFLIKWRWRDIPGPDPKWHGLGNIGQLRACAKTDKYYHYQFLLWAEEYGSVYKLLLLHKVLLICSDIKAAKTLLADSKCLKSASVYSMVSKACGKRFLGGGLVTNFDHDSWRQRSFHLSAPFQKRYLNGCLVEFNDIVDSWINKLQSSTSSLINMSDTLATVTLDLIAKVGFGLDLGAIDDSKSAFLHNMSTALHGMSISNKYPYLVCRLLYAQKTMNTQNAVDYIRRFSKAQINNRLQHQQKVHFPEREDFIDLLLKSKELVPGLTTQDLVDDFITIFVAGFDTAASLLPFILMELGRNAAILCRLREEIDSVMGDNDNIQSPQLDRLPFMTQVINESLRLYPPAPATVRDVTAGTCLARFTLPVDAPVIIPIFVMHRLNSNYTQAELFDPDRWSSQSMRSPSVAFLPFSLGHRSCAGQHFAMISIKMILCKFLKRFDFNLDGKQSFEIEEKTTLKVKNGLKLELTVRDM